MPAERRIGFVLEIPYSFCEQASFREHIFACRHRLCFHFEHYAGPRLETSSICIRVKCADPRTAVRSKRLRKPQSPWMRRFNPNVDGRDATIARPHGTLLLCSTFNFGSAAATRQATFLELNIFLGLLSYSEACIKAPSGGKLPRVQVLLLILSLGLKVLKGTERLLFCSTASANRVSLPPPLAGSLVARAVIRRNVVSTVNMGCRLELKEIALHARNAEYNPKRFAAVIMRIREPKTTALIFASGKMVCTGAKCEQHSKLAARKYARIIQKLGFPAQFKEFKIQNVVASCDVKFPIRLEGLAFSHGHFSSYEPELFPGLIYRMKQPKIVLLIFVSGKIVLTGAKVRDQIYEAFENIYPVLTEFRKIQQ